MNRRPHLTLVALIAAGLIGVGLLAIPGSPIHQTPTLGLDLQGGLEVTLKAVPPPNRPLQESDLDRSVEILRDRVDRLGVAEPEIRKQGSRPDRDRPAGPQEPGAGDRDPRQDRAARALRLRVQSRGSLDQCAGLPDREGLVVRAPRRAAGSRQRRTRRRPGTCSTTSRSCGSGRATTGTSCCRQTRSSEAGKAGTLPKGWKIFGAPPKTAVLKCGIGEESCPGVESGKAAHELLLPDPVRPHERGSGESRAGDDRRRSQAVGHAGGLRHDRPASRSC